jgi:hypothetical protein
MREILSVVQVRYQQFIGFHSSLCSRLDKVLIINIALQTLSIYNGINSSSILDKQHISKGERRVSKGLEIVNSLLDFIRLFVHG